MILLLFLYYDYSIFRDNSKLLEPRVILSPSGAVFVYPGGQLSFRCSTNLRYLEWNITVFQSLTGMSDSRRQLITFVSVDSPLTISGYSLILVLQEIQQMIPTH